jgi:hypothetical protein
VEEINFGSFVEDCFQQNQWKTFPPTYKFLCFLFNQLLITCHEILKIKRLNKNLNAYESNNSKKNVCDQPWASRLDLTRRPNPRTTTWG